MRSSTQISAITITSVIPKKLRQELVKRCKVNELIAVLTGCYEKDFVASIEINLE